VKLRRSQWTGYKTRKGDKEWIDNIIFDVFIAIFIKVTVMQDMTLCLSVICSQHLRDAS
jgi:hypothetical protein